MAMTPFISDITERLNELKSKNILKLKTIEYSTKYIGSASEENGKEITKLNDFQIAFINLFEEKNAELVEQFHLILENDLKKLVEPAEFEKINLDEDVGFYSLTIPQENGNDEWNIALATSFDETIFHAYFTGWQFQNLGLTI